MIAPGEKKPEDRFEESWKRWAARAPRQSPGEAAARIEGLIRVRRQRHRFRWGFAAAAAAILATFALTFQWIRVAPQPLSTPPTALEQKTPMLGDGEVLMWIDRDTPLYMTFAPPAEAQAKGGKL